ncbi:MAG: DUF3791 domain-containing protein [Duncaniella sp.]|nr:DUF3791 domain-containing protein [Duncaniella sp.]
MTEESRTVIRASKVAKIIMSLCELFGISLDEATDMYYTSAVSDMIEEGVADLQCRSEKYLATLIWEENHEGERK